MKKAIICAICDKPKKYSDSYALKIISYKYLANPTGEELEEFTTFTKETKVRACRVCIKKMGYHVKKGVTRIPLDNRLTKEL